MQVNAHLVAANVLRLEAGQPLLKYPEGVTGAACTPKIFCLSLGKYDGSLGFNRPASPLSPAYLGLCPGLLVVPKSAGA
jgi:hypothetical protein